MQKPLFMLAGTALLLAGTAFAEDDDKLAASVAVALDTVTVLGSREEIDEISGSAQLIGPAELDVFDYSDINRVLRSVPGVYIQEEEGLGLRPNIGIRGSGQDRSSRITLMEDGVLIAPAPYAAPSAYYFPTQRRMHAVEVLKGPAAVTEGPRTVGGALNLISTPIPEAASGRAEMLFGEDDTLDMYAHYGDSQENFGWVMETVQQDSSGFKRLPNNGDTGTQLQDYMAKFRINTSPGAEYAQALELKLGHTTQDGNETYLGLTDADFAIDPYQRYAASQRDNIATEHEQVQLTWTLEPADADWDLAVVGYRNDFARNWFKLGSVNGTGISTLLRDPDSYAQEMDWVRGATSPDDAFNLRNNNREYYAQGIQAEIDFDFMTGDLSHELEIGVRMHEDEEDRLQDEDLFRMDNGSLVLTTDGAIGSQANRVSSAEATALYVRDVVRAGDWQFTPGFRYEDIDLVRKDYDTADPDRSTGPTRVRRNNVSAFIPGVGVTWRMNNEWLLLGGVHKGFNPPGPGSDSDIEESLNIEFGTRYRNNGMFGEAIAFMTDYSNLVGTCTASTGGGCTIGDQFDGGEATVNGFEVRAGNNIGLDNGGTIPLNLAWTWTVTAEFDNSFSSGFGQWGNVNSGDELPYIPEHQFQLLTGYVHNGLDIAVAATWLDETRTVAGSGSIPAGESTDSYLVLDLSAAYSLSANTDVFLRVDNLLDEEYIVARAPAGVRPGKPRTALVGLRFDF